MLPYELDIHTHTVSSGHYTRDTATDMIKYAARTGIKLLESANTAPPSPIPAPFLISEASPWPPAAAWAFTYYTARK